MTQTPVDLLLSEAPARRATIALSEGHDPRVVAGALAARQAGIADVILIGDADTVRTGLSAQGVEDGNGIAVHDPVGSDLADEFSDIFYNLRRHRGVDPHSARQAVQDPLVYAALLVRSGRASGTVGGAVATTSDVVRTAIQVIGQASDATMVSSFFLMYPPENATAHARAMLYADCGLVIEPDTDQLAAIANASARSCRALLRQEPRIAMLSFSTKGSARHTRVSRVADATEKLRTIDPSLEVDGDLQFDAAFVPSVAAGKAPGSAVAGHANVMVFPDLDAGNIGYKITQRLGGYTAIGPILQGLAKPANDLSRGCVADDVTQMIAVTVLQAMANGA